MLDNTDKPSVDEIYQVAASTSNLTVEADRRGAGDVIIAAGWSPSRVGMALLRLHSEWACAAKPIRQGKAALDAIAATIKEDDAKEKAAAQRKGAPYAAKGSANLRAAALADRWYASELRLLATSLKSRAVVWQQLLAWVELRGIHPDTVAEALLYWLAPTCPTCNGHGLRKVPDQPALSARQCHKCHGTGDIPRPAGTAVVLNYMDDAVQKARNSLKSRLRQENF